MHLLAAVALVGVTVYTGQGPPIPAATVLIDGDRISAVGSHVPLPERVTLIDLEGSVVTPGFIDAYSRLGLVDVALENSAVEARATRHDDPVRAALRVADTFNPQSFAIPVARLGGITSGLIVPTGGLISGRASWVDLRPDVPIRNDSIALAVSIHARVDKPGERSRAFLRLREALDDARLFRANRGPYISRKLRDLSVSASDLRVLARALEDDLPVMFEVDRAADIRTVLEIVRTYKLHAILVGALEGWTLADRIAAAHIPVLIDPLENLPGSFDTLQSRSDAALILYRAGVQVAFTTRAAVHKAHRLRWLAGNAVAEGFPYVEALAAITRIPAQIFGIEDEGVLEPGALANLVVWNGDPLELSSWPVRIFIHGQSVPTRSRQDLLGERYRTAVPR